MSFYSNKDSSKIILQKLGDQDLFNILLTNSYFLSLTDNNF